MTVAELHRELTRLLALDAIDPGATVLLAVRPGGCVGTLRRIEPSDPLDDPAALWLEDAEPRRRRNRA